MVGSPPNREIFGFKNSTFSWSHESEDGSLTPASGWFFRLRVDGELIFKPNGINLIVGPTKFALNLVIINICGMNTHEQVKCISFERQLTLGSISPGTRDGGVTYSAHESWVQNQTICKNILFGSPFDAVRYRKVLRQRALERDLELLDAGDNTEVREKGLTLRGGQKQGRFTTHSASSSAWIVDKCFRGDLVTGRTVLLVTHNLALATPVAVFIVSLGQDGIPSCEAKSELDREILEAGSEDAEEIALPANKIDGKLIVAEEIVEGYVTRKSIKLFLTGFRRRPPISIFSLTAYREFAQ
ncbi:hypothetical protein M413DRAFT_28068 [Hebeloma cylindrosporum]|uniref:ABC transporter domain-containing protein n=1 Tax=Hebeloma cylindrosporum TaxID=76867 RepID=A0A0C2YIR3_HEBCY|nr:hypothetical protein M413DRAFT_28068 [Hebeloma cylindrosporum h7]